MTRLEFIETMKLLMPGVAIDETTSAIPFYDVRIIYDKLNIKIKGKIPFDVAQAIAQKYLCDKLYIKVGTIGNADEPKKLVTPLQIASIYLELVKGTKFAAGITINNISRDKVHK